MLIVDHWSVLVNILMHFGWEPSSLLQGWINYKRKYLVLTWHLIVIKNSKKSQKVLLRLIFEKSQSEIHANAEI